MKCLLANRFLIIQMFGILFGGRYIIMLMGLFAMYSGFMYNEVFAMPLNIFGSCWNVIYEYVYQSTIES